MDWPYLHMYVPTAHVHETQSLIFICSIGTFVILGDTYDSTTRSWNLSGAALVRHQDFWFTMGMTIL